MECLEASLAALLLRRPNQKPAGKSDEKVRSILKQTLRPGTPSNVATQLEGQVTQVLADLSASNKSDHSRSEVNSLLIRATTFLVAFLDVIDPERLKPCNDHTTRESASNPARNSASTSSPCPPASSARRYPCEIVAASWHCRRCPPPQHSSGYNAANRGACRLPGSGRPSPEIAAHTARSRAESLRFAARHRSGTAGGIGRGSAHARDALQPSDRVGGPKELRARVHPDLRDHVTQIGLRLEPMPPRTRQDRTEHRGTRTRSIVSQKKPIFGPIAWSLQPPLGFVVIVAQPPILRVPAQRVPLVEPPFVSGGADRVRAFASTPRCGLERQLENARHARGPSRCRSPAGSCQ